MLFIVVVRAYCSAKRFDCGIGDITSRMMSVRRFLPIKSFIRSTGVWLTFHAAADAEAEVEEVETCCLCETNCAFSGMVGFDPERMWSKLNAIGSCGA